MGLDENVQSTGDMPNYMPYDAPVKQAEYSTSSPLMNAGYDYSKSAAYEEAGVVNYEHHEHSKQRCGALGDCLGWNSPPDHEAVRRNMFLRKVFAIVFVQLLIVSVIVTLMIVLGYYYPTAAYSTTMFAFVWVAIFIEFISLFVLFCVRRKTPINFIVLFIFTASTGFMVGSVCMYYSIPEIVQAAVICLIVTATLVLFTLITKSDFRFLGIFLFIGLEILILWSLLWCLTFWWLYPYWLYQLINLFGVFLFMGFILFDVSRLMKKHDPDEYILAAVNLYLDIINLFLFILALFGGKK